METLRFISTPSQAKKLSDHLKNNGLKKRSVRGLEVEATSVRAIKEICESYAVNFEILSIDTFLRLQPKDGISLLLDAEIEPIVYTEFWCPPLHVDGYEINKIVSDKYRVYKMLLGVEGVKQPKTLPIHNHLEVQNAIKTIESDKVVLKPRTYGHSSRNVLILTKNRLKELKDDECLNFHDFLIQEYLPKSLWPPREIRIHFVGRKMCRYLKIFDKNNWAKAFKIEDLPLSEIPEHLKNIAAKIAAILVNSRNRDNFTLDFLETKNGPLFLEANCGALGSFYIDNPKNKNFLQEIFTTLFRRYFKKQTLLKNNIKK